MFRSERPSSARMNHGLESRIPFGITPGVGLQIVMRLPWVLCGNGQRKELVYFMVAQKSGRLA